MSGTRVPCSFVGLSGLASLERSNKRRAASDVLRGFQDREWRAGDVCVRAFKVDGQGTIVSFRHKAKVGAWDFTQVSLEGCEVFSGAPEDARMMRTVRDSFCQFMKSGVSSQVLEYVSRLDPEERLCLTGFELGGIMAQLFALVCRPETVLVMAMGKPLFANQSFARWYNSRVHYQTTFIAFGDTILDYSRKRANGLWEDCEAIIIDNEEILPIVYDADDDTICHHAVNYYRRCFNNLQRRRQFMGFQGSLHPVIAANRIVRFVRRNLKSKGMISRARFLMDAGILKRPETKIPFEQFTDKLRDPTVISNMARFVCNLLYLIRRAHVRAKIGTDSLKDQNNSGFVTRQLLAAFMINWYPMSCFESFEKMEEELQGYAIVMTEQLCKVAEEMTAPGFTFSFDSFLRWVSAENALFNYLPAFQRWKVPDERKLITRLAHALKALYIAHHKLPKRGHAEYLHVHEDFIEQKKKLRLKYEQIGGKEKLAELDVELKDMEVEQFEVEGGVVDNPVTGVKQRKNALVELPGRMSNEQLSYELYLDPTFKLNDQKAGYVDNDVLSQVRESFRVAFWDSLVDDMKLETPVYCRVVKVLGEIVDGYCDLVPSEKAFLKESVDLKLIQEQISHGNMEWSSVVVLFRFLAGKVHNLKGFKVFSYVIPSVFLTGMMGQENAKEHMKTWEEIDSTLDSVTVEEQPTIIRNTLSFILDGVNKGRVFAANERLSKIVYVIKQHGPEYFQTHTRKKIEKNPQLQEGNKVWIKRVADDLIGKKQISLEDLQGGSAEVYTKVVKHAILKMATDDTYLDEVTVPLLMSLDVKRLREFRLDFAMDRIGVAMVGMANQRLKSWKSKQESVELVKSLVEFFNKFKLSEKLSSDLYENYDHQRQIEVVLEALDVSISLAQKEFIASVMEQPQCDLAAFLKFDDNVWGITHGVIYKRWYEVISMKQVPVIPPDSFKKDVYERVFYNARRLHRIVTQNMSIYTPFYNDIIASIYSKSA